MKTISSRAQVTALTLILGTALLACASKSPNTASSSAAVENGDGSEASASIAQTSRFEEMIASPITSQDPATAAANVAAAQWWPAGCATRVKDPTNSSVVHIHLADCTGPFGLEHHTGEIVVTFSKNADGSLHAQAASSNMTVNGHAVTYSRDADITVSATERTVKANGAWTRENAKGETISHTSNTTTVLDIASKCRTTNGTAVTKVDERENDAKITDYKICRKPDGLDGCPSGTVTHTHKLSGHVITATFDGTAKAELTGAKGGMVAVSLVCTP
jgi:hypothetical protein